MDMYEVIRVRRSIRKYKAKGIEEDKLFRVLEAGRLSPSARNEQPWHFIVITNPEVREMMKEGDSRSWFYEAPAILVVCVDPNVAWVREDGEEYCKIDGAIAMQSMILQATEEGLGTCWIADFHEAAVTRILGIPPHIRIVALTPLGYPDEVKGRATKRKEMNEIIHNDKW